MGMLEGKVAIVTGAGRGLGRSHALLLAEEGAYLCTDHAADITGQTFVVGGDQVQLMEGWTKANRIKKDRDRFTLDDLVERRAELFGDRPTGLKKFSG